MHALSKRDELKQLLDAGKHRAALKLAASAPRLLQTHKDAILAGYAAATNPAFYRELGRNPDDLVAAGVAAIQARYDLGKMT